jgi:hypothetical protein
MFSIYFQLGLEHIANIKAYDHILFLLTLMAVYLPGEWKQVLILITAFTIGHSTTLILATLDFINFDSYIIEILIPVTILLTAIINVIAPDDRKNKKARYAMAMIFGLIHGLGFSSTIKAMLMDESSILLPLFGFNVGVEAGQIIVVSLIMLLTVVVLFSAKINFKNWKYLLSGAGMGTALIMIVDRV